MAENIFNDKALQTYLNEIAEIVPLTREKEHALAIKAQKGDQAAIEKLVTSNLKFVVKIAAKYQNRGLTLSELISEGNMGLIKAIDKFDPGLHNKLISYAVWWIRQKILFALAEKTSVIRMPLGKATQANKIKYAKDKVFSETGQQATIEEISEITELDENIIKKVSARNKNALSIDNADFSRNSSNVALSDLLTDRSGIDPKTLYYREKVEESIDKSINTLGSREAYIVKQYFGLEGGRTKNFAQIGEELGLSRERVRQIQKATLKKILEDSYSEIDNDFDNLLSS